jgi:hypothetical protein
MKHGVVVIVTNPTKLENGFSFEVSFFSTSDRSLDTLIDVNSPGITINNLFSSGFDLVSCIGFIDVDWAQYTFVKGN